MGAYLDEQQRHGDSHQQLHNSRRENEKIINIISKILFCDYDEGAYKKHIIQTRDKAGNNNICTSYLHRIGIGKECRQKCHKEQAVEGIHYSPVAAVTLIGLCIIYTQTWGS